MNRPPLGTKAWFAWKAEQEGFRVLGQIEDDWLHDLEIEAIMSAPPGYSRIVDGWATYAQIRRGLVR